VKVYGCVRVLRALAFAAVWPTVLGLRPIPVVLVRDPEGRTRDADLFATDVQARRRWVRTMLAWRWAIESEFSRSKRRLGSALRARKWANPQKEILLRVLTHNLLILGRRT
jgi:hypothetical protein